MSRRKKLSNTERCWYSQLIQNQCDHCRKGGSKSDEFDQRPVLDEVIVANFEGTCQVCLDDIIPGDHVGVIDEVKVSGKDEKVKRWAHYGCGR